jgi:hypothetical protein
LLVCQVDHSLHACQMENVWEGCAAEEDAATAAAAGRPAGRLACKHAFTRRERQHASTGRQKGPHLEVVLGQKDQQCLPAQAIDCGSLHVGLQEQARQVGQAGEAQS